MRYLMSVIALLNFISDYITNCFICTVTACFIKDLYEIDMLTPE